jgi:hypothetical protein
MSNTYNVSLCGDCVYTDANGWDESQTGEPLPTPVPLSLIDDGDLIGPDENDHICEGHFSWTPCDGCGNTLGGNRYCYIVYVAIQNRN